VDVSGCGVYDFPVSRTEPLPPGTEVDQVPPAPGRLELVRSFLSLHGHVVSSPQSFPPSPQMLLWWLRNRGLLGRRQEPTDEDLAWVGEVRDALRARVGKGDPKARDRAAARLDRAAGEAGMRIVFEDRSERLQPSEGGVRGAVGTLLGITFLAELDGSWNHLKRCDSPTCLSVFYDQSKNHSGKWCSMSSCGNRAKVRAFRERNRAG
jgi:hypothetical protein